MPPRTTDFRALLEVLSAGNVEFVVIGGVAAALHGAARATFDLDVVYSRTTENIERVVRVLSPLTPYLRGAPARLPFTLDVPTVQRGLNFTLDTSLGSLDLLGEVVGGGRYDDLLASTEDIELFGYRCRCVSLDGLIELKRASGGPKDNEVLAELELIRVRRSNG